MLWCYDDGNKEYDDDDDESTLAISQVFNRLHISNRSGTRVMAWKLSKWKIIIETFQQNKISVVLFFLGRRLRWCSNTKWIARKAANYLDPTSLRCPLYWLEWLDSRILWCHQKTMSIQSKQTIGRCTVLQLKSGSVTHCRRLHRIKRAPPIRRGEDGC